VSEEKSWGKGRKEKERKEKKRKEKENKCGWDSLPLYIPHSQFSHGARLWWL
jgi:hypothetical protein